MKKMFSAFVLTFAFAFTAFADQAGSLEAHMKEIGDIFKTVGGSISDASQNSNNAAAAQKMAELFLLTKSQAPEALNDVPDAQKDAFYQGYQAMIQQCVDLCVQMQQAFMNNDNAQAQQIYRQLKDLKHDGHDQYDP